MTDKEAIMYKALQDILNIKTQDCAKYVAKADSIALDAVVAVDLLTEEKEGVGI